MDLTGPFSACIIEAILKLISSFLFLKLNNNIDLKVFERLNEMTRSMTDIWWMLLFLFSLYIIYCHDVLNNCIVDKPSLSILPLKSIKEMIQYIEKLMPETSNVLTLCSDLQITFGLFLCSFNLFLVADVPWLFIS